MQTRYPFPKAELHLHLDGSIAPETMWDLAEKEGKALPTETLDEFKEWIKTTANCKDVNTYLERFELPVSILQKPENLTRVTEELIDLLASEGYGYAEIRYAPQLHLREKMTMADSVDAVLLGRKNALARHPEMGVGIILCAMSIGPETLNMDLNLETVRLTKQYLGTGVVACDLAGAEGIVPLRNFHPIFDLARELDVPFTVHSGDTDVKDMVKDGMDFGSKRLGHGHHLYEAKDLWERAIRDKVTLEVCPTSNVQCQTRPSYAEHPAKKLFDAGIRVTISTDNRALAAVTLDEEYDHCINEMGFTMKDLVQMNIYAIEAAFMSEDEKQKRITELKKYL